MVMFKHLFALVVCLIVSTMALNTDALAAPVDIKSKISTDKANLYAGDNFTLIIDITSPRPFKKTDLKYNALAKNFTVGNVGFKETKLSKTNEYRWTIPLLSSTPGVVKVDSMPLGSNLSTPKFELNIRKQEGIHAKDFVKAQLRNRHLIQGQLAMYRVEIDVLPGMKIETVSKPSAPDATFELLSERTISRANAQRAFVYKTRIQEYKVIFNRPGKKIIKAPVVSGYYTNAQKNKFMQSAKEIDVTIGENNSSALISENLSIVVKWQPEDTDIAVGTPISRTINIRGTNNSLNQLPKVALPEVPNFDVYEDEPVESEKLMRNKQLIATREIRQVFIPRRNHTVFKLDNIQFEWMNPNDGSIKNIVIPGAEYNVDGFSFNDYIPSDPRTAYWIIMGIAGFLMFLAFMYYSFINYRRRRGVYGWLHSKVDYAMYWHQLSSKWSTAEPVVTRDAIIQWAQKRWVQYNIVGLKDIPFYDSLKEEFEALSKACWSKEKYAWNGNDLYRKLAQFRNYEKPKLKHGINPYGLNGEIYETVTQQLKK